MNAPKADEGMNKYKKKTKRYAVVLDSKGAVLTPRDAHVGCEKLNAKTKNADI